MNRFATLRHFALLLSLAAVSALPAAAQFAYTGTTTGAPTYTRPSSSYPVSGSSGNIVRYNSFVFTPTTSGTYQFLSTTLPQAFPETASWNNLTFLYAGSGFNTAAPSVNALIANDEFVDSINDPTLTRQTGKSGFRFDLVGGNAYTFVTTGLNNAAFGAFSNTIDLLDIPPKTNYAGTIPSAAVGPTFTRPLIPMGGSLPSSLSSQVVGYNVVNFTVPTDGIYDVVGLSSVANGPYSYLYANGFNPASPLTNIIGGNDFYNATFGLTGVTKALTAGTNYSFVLANQSSFGAGGAYTAYVQRVAVAVPEAGTLSLIGMGLALGITGAVRGRRRA